MIARHSPQAVVCLLSALHFHELTAETPSELWIALPRNAWIPRNAVVRFKVVHLTGAAFTAGIEEHQIEGLAVRIYSIAKTVVDCFKFRNQVGTQVAVEALRDAWRSRKVTVEDLWHHAKVCRVSSVIRPYLETVVQGTAHREYLREGLLQPLAPLPDVPRRRRRFFMIPDESYT